MKKYLLIGLVAMMGLGMMSCSGSSCDCKHEPVLPSQFNKKTIDLVVNQQEWKFDNDTKQFYAHFDLPELTSDIYNYGNYSLHREYNTGKKDAYQVALPESSFRVEEIDDGHGGTQNIYYTQMVDYRVGVEYVEIQVTNSDYSYGAANPESMVFRLQLTY